MAKLPRDSEAMYCFLDADVLLHFTTFDQVDWRKFLDAKQVYLVLTITVISELNKHKDDGSKPHLQQRARDLLPKIFKLLNSTPGPARVKDGVFLLTLPREPVVNWLERELDPEVNDDRILARMILFKEHFPEAKVLFLTNDYSSVLKANDRAIRTIMPDDQEFTRIELKSSLEAKLRAVQKELSEYKNRLPQLELGFFNNQALTATITCPYAGYDAQHAEVLSQALSEDYIPKQVIHQQTEFKRILDMSQRHVSDRQIREYTKEYEEYLEKLAPALKRQLMRRWGQECHLSFLIRNVGTAPVNDLTIAFHFPPGTLVIDADDAEKESKIPNEPIPSWMVDPPSAFVKSNPNRNLFGLDLAMPSMSIMSPDFTWRMHMLRAQYEAQRTYWGPLCNETRDSHIVYYRAKKLQHDGDSWAMQPIIAYLIPRNERGFSIDYSIHADENLKKTLGKLCVQWEQPTS